MFNKVFPKIVPFYEIMWKNTVEPDRSQMTIRPMSIECFVTKATDTHSEYVTFIVFPLQQWLHESRLSVTLYVHCLSCCLSFVCDIFKQQSTDVGYGYYYVHRYKA